MTEILTDSQKDKQAETLLTYIQEEMENVGVETVFAELFSEVERQIEDIDK